MKRKSDDIPNIVSRVTINDVVYYYLSDGNVYEIDDQNDKLVKLGEDKKQIIKAVKDKFVRKPNVMNDVLLKEEER